MEVRSSNLIVGIFVLVLSIGTAIFGVWLAQRDVDRTFTEYEIVFPGSVFGLSEGSQVLFRGVPVGRVLDIRLDPENIDQVLVGIEVEQSTPVTIDTHAALVPQGVTGLVVVELRGGSLDAPRRTAERGRPQIAGRVSAIEQVFTSTPELLARAVVILERIGTAISDANIQRVSSTLDNIDQLTTTIAGRTDDIDQLLALAGTVGEDGSQALERLGGLVEQVELLTSTLEQEVTGLSSRGDGLFEEVERTAAAARNLVWRADRMLAASEQPLQDFSEGGLYEFSEMVRELRVLVATMSRIATDFERDPAGFLIGGSGRGFTPQ
jgi:phospholipid/cholesterol/gamma-HCH transport system substrate-binding protein